MTVSLGTGGTSCDQQDVISHRYLQQSLDGSQHWVDCIPYRHQYCYDCHFGRLHLFNSFFYSHGVVHVHLVHNLVNRDVCLHG